ncbi:nitroreductase family protein [Pontibacillus litoralis]|uniref:Putative NAD(P)H nitroreductase n=1 Tax=Pontibacillus litoralis JSM 072002 TaxID=1385512 RepID=A0A0A5FZB5_9BACI|nr:nitroreductase [Pontibacillus litoralis]KGX85139.1 hypothetical protein N784_10150 [Pontibacillus litoralis JSM 072002]
MLSTQTTIQQVIKERRTIRNFTNEPIDIQEMVDLLDVAVYAPNHKTREPWSFMAITSNARTKMYDEIVNSYERQHIFEGYAQETVNKKKEKLYDMMHQCPIHLIVTMDQADERKVWEEDFAATCAMMQNLQLLGWERNIGMVWKTNPYIQDKEFYKAMGIDPTKKIVGVLHIGRPAKIPKAKDRTPVVDKLVIRNAY